MQPNNRSTPVTREEACSRIVDVRLGRDVRIAAFVNLYGCEIGDETKIGAFVEIQRGAVIGRQCKISSHSFICEGVRIGSSVFVGHGVMFTNDKHPRAAKDGKLITNEWTMLETIVEDEASIGSNATILCGLRIGRGALVGAGAVVTRNVPPGATVIGNPAKLIERDLNDVDAKRVPFVDLSCQWREIAIDVRSQFDRIFETSQFCLGPAVEKFERAFAEHLGVKHVIAVNSGTSALHLGALAAGLGPGDEVLLPSHTFIATAWGPIYAGATPVFCDVLPGCGTIDLEDAEKRLTRRTKAIIPVHIYGQPCNMAAIEEFASKHRLIIIEDASQAACARWRDGRRIGAIGALGCFSFYPGKNLGGAGEGGAVATNDDAYAALMRALRNHGQVERYKHNHIGFNYRMDGFQGAVLGRKMAEIERWTERRRAIARRYCKGLAGCGVELPALDGRDHVFHLFVVRERRRDELRRHLADHGIETGLHYPIPLHRQPCLAPWAPSAVSLRIADDWADRGLSLPMYYGMTNEQADLVVAAVKSFYAGQHKEAPSQSLAC